MKLPWPDKLTALGTAGVFLLGIGGGLAYAFRVDGQVRTDAAAIRDHEARLRGLETTSAAQAGDLKVVREDVDWIRTYFDPQHHRTARNP